MDFDEFVVGELYLCGLMWLILFGEVIMLMVCGCGVVLGM